jgi:hypothetical protein
LLLQILLKRVSPTHFYLHLELLKGTVSWG